MKKNSLTYGLAIGILIPIFAFGVLLLLFGSLDLMGWASTEGFTPNFRERTMGIVAIGLNAIPMNMAYKKKFTNTMRGIVIPTFIFVVIWLIFFARIIL